MAGKEGQKNRFWSDEGKVATRAQARVPSEFPGDQFPGKRWRPARRRGCLAQHTLIFSFSIVATRAQARVPRGLSADFSLN